MKIAAILVASLLAITGRAAPTSELADDGLQLYKRQPPPPPPAPPLPESSPTSKPYDWMAELKGKKSNKLAGESGSAKALQPSGPFQLGQIPEEGVRLKSVNRDKKLWDAESGSEDRVIKNNDDPNFKPKPKSSSKTPGKAPPLPPSNGGRIPSNWRKTADVDSSTKPSSATSASKTNSNIRVKLPDFDPKEVKLKPTTTRKRKSEPPTSEPPSYKSRLRKTPNRNDPKGQDADSSDTDEERTGREPSTSHQKKSSQAKTPLKVAPHLKPKPSKEARKKAGLF
ncbi:hypothetical protein BASA50_000197 [Batrachochytrium salamandrivorans]|uniref:Uncharacterized protein n=1 Tax=Batrachochytrium salamandrivorans TaxID=1357716 RepID=A0ABQ8EUN4_9FUNG|nr:hypothetical protein BASA50_000197 [Batrachochytrium salamandrivorans]